MKWFHITEQMLIRLSSQLNFDNVYFIQKLYYFQNVMYYLVHTNNSVRTSEGACSWIENLAFSSSSVSHLVTNCKLRKNN